MSVLDQIPNISPQNIKDNTAKRLVAVYFKQSTYDKILALAMSKGYTKTSSRGVGGNNCRSITAFVRAVIFTALDIEKE